MFNFNNSSSASYINEQLSYWEAAYDAARLKGIDCSMEHERCEYWLAALREEESKAKDSSHRMEVARMVGAMFLMIAVFIPVVGGGSLLTRSLLESNSVITNAN